MRRLALLGLMGAALAAGSPAQAEPTPLVIRVLSQGGKFVGSGMGGVEIVVRDLRSGAILARGKTQGSTGDTRRIMAGGPRNTALADDGSAAFRTSIDIDEPRLVEVEAYGPLAQPQAAVRATAQRWVLPGRAVDQGDGWVLELPGLVVDGVSPPAHQRLAAGVRSVRVGANIALMCGCPIEPGGLWDAARFDVRAAVRINDNDAKGDEVSLAYAGATGFFAADLPLSRPGDYVVTITAVDRQTGATGIDRTSFIVQ